MRQNNAEKIPGRGTIVIIIAFRRIRALSPRHLSADSPFGRGFAIFAFDVVGDGAR